MALPFTSRSILVLAFSFRSVISLVLAVDYGFQSRDLAFRSSQDYWAVSAVVSWNVFNGGQDAARRTAATGMTMVHRTAATWMTVVHRTAATWANPPVT